jgi:hypothetical protein
MDDQQVLSRIDDLVQEEEQLLHRHEGEGEGLTPEEHARLEELKVQLDQAWDYLRQRRALRQYGDDPDEASPRDAGTVEGYEDRPDWDDTDPSTPA